MLKPNPVVIDGNLFLNVFSSAILGNMKDEDIIHNGDNKDPMYRGRGIIIKSFLVMIFSNAKKMQKKGINTTHFSIVWDKRINGKYHKSDILDKLADGDTYKGDRKYVSVEDLDNENLSPEERIKIEADLIRNRERYEAREFIKNNLGKYGIKSFSQPGWEADDIDLIWAEETEKLGGYQIHYSGDSDWSFHLRPKDYFWQVNRSKLYLKTYDDVKVKFKIPEHLNLMEWAELNYSAFGSHNFLQRTFDTSIKRVTKKYKDKLFSGDFSDITNLDRFNAQRKCFKIDTFPGIDSVRELYKEMLNHKPTATSVEFKDLLKELSLSDQSYHSLLNSYNSFMKITLDSKLNNISL